MYESRKKKVGLLGYLISFIFDGMRRLHLLMFICLSIFFTSCAGSLDKLFKHGFVSGTTPKVLRDVYKQESHTFNYDSISGSKVQLTYLGSGGFIFERDTSSLMVDPYFSHQNFLNLGLSKLFFIKTLKTDTSVANRALVNYEGKANSIWISHAHYDHLMDVPYVYSKYAKQNAKVYCSQSGANNLKYLKGINKNVVMLDSSNVSYGKHIGISHYLQDSSIRVTPILGEHAPHLGDCKFYKGTASTNDKYNTPLSKSRAEMWREGLTFSFVIDFLDQQKEVDFRIFLQSSASTPKVGWIPERLKGPEVDLAILGAASFHNVDNYPCRLINENLTPKYLVVCHWEDFFRPYEKTKKKTVRGTDMKKYIQQLNSVYPWKIEGVEKFILPKPGAVITLE